MLALIFSFLTATLVAPLVIHLYRRKGWLDDPDTNTHVKATHAHAVPRGGGLVILIATALPMLTLLHVDHYLLAILLGAALLALVGTLDDIFDIHPVIRLGTGLLAGLLVVGSGIGIAYVTNPIGPGVIHLDQPQLIFSWLGEQRHIWILADLFALIFILWNMNIVNWAKGVDGQMPGFVSIAMLIIAALSTRFADDPTQFNSAQFSLIVAGAFAGLLVWNWFPQKMMPGYGAGSLAGYFLSIAAIIAGAKVATTLMVLGVPTADALFTVLRRIRAGKSPLWGDRGHLHHKLLDVLGWSRQQVALFYWLSSLFLGILSLFLSSLGKLLVLGMTIALVFSFLIWAKLKTTPRRSND